MPSRPRGASARQAAGHEPGPRLRLRGERPWRRRRARRRPPGRPRRRGTRPGGAAVARHRSRSCARPASIGATLSLIAVTIGPGSFTGVRVGLAAARGLAVGLGVPLAGLATTSVLLAQAAPRDRLVVAAIDSRLGDWFCAIGEGDAAALRRLGARACGAPGRPGVPRRRRRRARRWRRSSSRPASTRWPRRPCPIPSPSPAWPPTPASMPGARATRSEGLPRPLYLRGVNITLPDGARRTVD